MIPDQLMQLLTAFVDGELSQRQRKAVMRLLHRSSEAREMLRQLQENVHKLKQLPRRKVEPSLVDDVMQAIALQLAQPAPLPRKAAHRRWLPYVAASIAAGLLISALGILYWKTMGDRDPEKMIEENFSGLIKPVPNDVFAANFEDLLEGGNKSSEFEQLVNREKAVELNIVVEKKPQPLRLLKEKLFERRIKLVTDPSAMKPLKDKGVQYLVYAENLTADEVTKLMADLGQKVVDPGQKNQRRVASPYKKVTVAPISPDDQQRLAKLRGEPTKVNPAPTKQRKFVVLPVSDGVKPSPEVIEALNQRRAAQPGTVQILMRIRLEN